jgi:hypothetical protein
MFQNLPITTRQLKATEGRLQSIYDAAKRGLRGENLALAAGMLPTEFRRLCEMDPMAALAEQKGRADAELEMSNTLYEAALNGDAKAALEMLKHKHGWYSTQHVQVDVTQQISVIAALEKADQRVDANVIEGGIVDKLPDRANGLAALTNQRERNDDGCQHSDTRPRQNATVVRP